jgi:hypothetical protein
MNKLFIFTFKILLVVLLPLALAAGCRQYITPPSPAPVPPSTNTANARIFSIGDTVEVYNAGGLGLAVFETPCSNLIGAKFDGSRGVVLDGPVYCRSYNRWLIQWSDGLQGWSFETWLRKIS